MSKPRAHYYTDDECGGVREDRENTLAMTQAEVNCSECIGMMYDTGVMGTSL